MRGAAKAGEAVASPLPPAPPEGCQQEPLKRLGQQSVCTPTLVPPISLIAPSSVLSLPRGQAQDYLSFLALSTSNPEASPDAKGGVYSMSRAAQPASRCTKNQRVAVAPLPRQWNLHHAAEASAAPTTPTDEAASGLGAPSQRLHKNRRAPPPASADDANRRVRFWWSRGTTHQAAAAAAPPTAAAATAAARGENSQQDPAGLDKPQRPACLARAAAALGASSAPQGKRAKVTFAPQGPRLPLSARRACSSCIKTRTLHQRPTGEPTATTAAAPAVAATTTVAPANPGIPSGGPSPATARQLPPKSSLGAPVSEQAARRAPPARPPPSRPQQLQQPLLLQQQQQQRDEDLSSVEFSSPQSHEGRQLPPTSLDPAVEPRAAEGASLAATRAAAVAKAAAAVAAAAQAEVEAAAAAAAAWGGTGEYKASSSGLSTEQRREQLMLVLRLLLLLPPELQHAVQARLFMLQQQRHRLSPIAQSPWSKRAATTTNLHMSLSASGSLKAPWKPLQPPRGEGEAATASAASAALSAGLSTELRKNSSRHSSSNHSSSRHSNSSHSSSSSSSSSNSSTGRVTSTVNSSGIQQQHEDQHEHLQETASASTVNGLFMSATLQASAVLQLTPGRPTADTAAGTGAFAGGSAAQISASGRLPSCRCRSGAAACHRPLLSLSSHGRIPTLQQQQQQQRQQQAQLGIRRSSEDPHAGCLLGSQQQQQEAQPSEARGALGRKSLGGAPQSSICRVHLGSAKPKTEAPWMSEVVSVGASSSGAPQPGVVTRCMRCGGTAPTAASSSDAACSCTTKRAAGASGQLACLLPLGSSAATIGSRAAQQCKGSQQLSRCESSASQSAANKTGAPAAASTAADGCRGSIKTSCASRSSSAARVQQQAARDDETTAAAAGASLSVAGGPPNEDCSCGVDGSAASALELRKLRGSGALQQGATQDVFSLSPTQVVGVDLRPCSSGCNSNGSKRRWNQDLLQLHLTSLPSLLRAESTVERRNPAADLRALTAPHARLMVASRSIEGGGPQRALAITVHTAASNSGNTESSCPATSSSLSETSPGKEAGEVLVLSEVEEKKGAPHSRSSQRQQKGDSLDLDARAAAAAAASVLSRVFLDRVGDEEGAHPRMLLSPGFEGLPLMPEAVSFSSSPALTLEALTSPRLPRAESLADVEQVGGEEEAGGWPTAAWRWGLRTTPPSEDLHASWMYGFPPLPEATNLSSSTSLRGPTSLFFCANDPRGYKGPLVRSAAVISVGTLSASAVRSPSRGGGPINLSAGSVSGKAIPRQGSSPMLQLKVVSVGGSFSPQTEIAFQNLQEQERRHPSSCPNLQHNMQQQRNSSAEKLLGGVVCSVAWRRTEAADLLELRKKAGGAVLPLGFLQASARFRSHTSLCHATSRHDTKMPGPLFTKEPLQCAYPPDMASDCEEASPVAAAFKDSPAFTRVPCAEENGPVLMETSDFKREEGWMGGGAQEDQLALAAEAASEVPASPQVSPARASRRGAPMQREGPPVKAMAKTLESSKRGSSSSTADSRMPLHALDSHSRSATTPILKGANQLQTSQWLSGNLTAVKEACGIVADGDVASPETQQDASFFASHHVSPRSTVEPSRPTGNQQNSARKKTQEEAERKLSTSSRFLDLLGIDADRSLPKDLEDILQAAARVQEDLSSKHQEELRALRAAAAQVEADPAAFPRVLSLYVEAIERRCHSAMQRTLKAKRAMASLQLAEEERVQLLRRLRSEPTTPSRTFADVNTACPSGDDQPTVISSSQRLTNQVPVFAVSSAESDAQETKTSSTSPEEAEGPSISASDPDFFSLQEECDLNKQIGGLRRLASAPRLALRGQDRAEPPCLRSLRNISRSSSALRGLTGGSKGNVRFSLNSLEDFSVNQKVVSAFLDQFASWQFESAPESEAEESFLKQLQKDFAASNASARTSACSQGERKLVELDFFPRAESIMLRLSADGSPSTLEQFLLRQREAALQELPREMATPEGIRKLLYPVAKHVAQMLTPPVSELQELQQHVTQSVGLSGEFSAAPLPIEEPCTPAQVAGVLERLKANHASALSGDGACAQGESQFTGAALNSWHDSMQQLEASMEDEVETLIRLCSDSLEKVKQTYERIMPVRVVRLQSSRQRYSRQGKKETESSDMWSGPLREPGKRGSCEVGIANLCATKTSPPKA